jgi:hypothetical protein
MQGVSSLNEGNSGFKEGCDPWINLLAALKKTVFSV